MTTSDLIQSVSVIIAIFSLFISIRTLYLLRRERTLAYRQTLYSMQAETYKEVIAYLSDANDVLVKAEYVIVHGAKWGKLSDSLFSNTSGDETQELYSKEQRMKDIVDITNEKLELVMHQRRIWSGVLPNTMIEKIDAFVDEYEKAFERLLNHQYSPVDATIRLPVTNAYWKVIEAIRNILQIDSLNKQSFEVFEQSSQRLIQRLGLKKRRS